MENMMKRVDNEQEITQENTEAISFIDLTSRKTQDKTEGKPDCVQEEQWTPGHEVEHCQYESELHDKVNNCLKNPGHRDFIISSDFTLQHLPKGHRNNIVWDFIQTVISLTVRVVVSYVSKDRPDDYPLSDKRGSYGMSFGSGWVRVVCRKSTEKHGGKCPCRACENSPDKAKTKWALFVVRTALHVVYDSEECKHSKCDVGFDRDEDRHTCEYLDGLKVGFSNIENDWCRMLCVSHDEDVINKMEEMVSRYDDLHGKLRDKYKRSVYADMSKVAVVCVSHPHGQAKHVTVGEFRGQQVHPPYAYKYSTGTCRGTSGGPIIRLGRWRGDRLEDDMLGYPSLHSRSLPTGENQSGDNGWL